MSSTAISPSAEPISAEVDPHTDAAAPFNPIDADIIISSSDGTHFRLHRLILSLASPVFRQMFSLPQPADSTLEIPIIPVSEDSKLLYHVLRLCYPGEGPSIATLDGWTNVIETLMKYDMAEVAKGCSAYFAPHIADDPVAVFALACHYGWEALARRAAKQTLKTPLRTLQPGATPYLRYMAANHYHALLLYHQQCGDVAATTGATLPWSSPNWIWITCLNCTVHPTQFPMAGGIGLRPARSWIFDFVDRAHALLRDVPAADVSALAFLVPTLERMAICSGRCGRSGSGQLAKWVETIFIPAVAEATDKVVLDLKF
ncbi:hypothetical protein DFH09DRAFT_1175499, partial [Mycena vulgaris]